MSMHCESMHCEDPSSHRMHLDGTGGDDCMADLPPSHDWSAMQAGKTVPVKKWDYCDTMASNTVLECLARLKDIDNDRYDLYSSTGATSGGVDHGTVLTIHLDAKFLMSFVIHHSFRGLSEEKFYQVGVKITYECDDMSNVHESTTEFLPKEPAIYMKLCATVLNEEFGDSLASVEAFITNANGSPRYSRTYNAHQQREIKLQQTLQARQKDMLAKIKAAIERELGIANRKVFLVT